MKIVRHGGYCNPYPNIIHIPPLWRGYISNCRVIEELQEISLAGVDGLVLFPGQLYRILPKPSVHGGIKWNDGGRATAWSCRQACDVMETCVAFDYNFPHKDCFLHTAETINGKAEINGDVDHFEPTGELWNSCTIGNQLLIIVNSPMKNHISFFGNWWS